jgi:pyrroloquinoline quinone biosynthesis protein D
MQEPRFAKNPDLHVEDMDPEILLYERGSHRTIYLNETAAVVWKLCDGTRTLADVVGLLSDHYPEAGTALALEVEQTVEMLLREGALSAEL